MSYALGLVLSWGTALLGFVVNPAPIILISYGIVNPILFSLPRLSYRLRQGLRARVSPHWVKAMEVAGSALILINAPGSLFLHRMGIQYDRFLHFSAGFFLMYLAVPFFTAIVRKPAWQENGKKILLVSAGVVFIGLFGFELYQFSLDQIFGTQLFHDAAQPIRRDVTEDIIFGSFGLLLGALELARRRWSWKFFADRVVAH